MEHKQALGSISNTTRKEKKEEREKEIFEKVGGPRPQERDEQAFRGGRSGGQAVRELPQMGRQHMQGTEGQARDALRNEKKKQGSRRQWRCTHG